MTNERQAPGWLLSHSPQRQLCSSPPCPQASPLLSGFPSRKQGFPSRKQLEGIPRARSACVPTHIAHFLPGQVSCLRRKKGTHPSAVDSTLLAYSGILFWSFFLTSLLRLFPTEYKHAIISSSLKKNLKSFLDPTSSC